MKTVEDAIVVLCVRIENFVREKGFNLCLALHFSNMDVRDGIEFRIWTWSV